MTSTPAFAGYSLDGPRTREEMAARRKAALARMDGTARRHEAESAAARRRRIEAPLPGFALKCGGDGPYEPADVLTAVADAYAGSSRAEWRGAAAYWLLGLTRLDPAEVSPWLGLAGPKDAIAAARRFARMERLPALDESDFETPDDKGRA